MLLPLGVAAIVVIALILGQALMTYRTQRATTSANEASTPLPSQLQRSDAITLVRGLTSMVGSVDRIDAKLMTWDEYIRGAGPVRAIPGDPAATADIQASFSFVGDPTHRSIWAVAVSGNVWPNQRTPVYYGGPNPAGSTPYPPYRWGVFIVDAVQGRFVIVGSAGNSESWPGFFATLPDHPVAPAVAPASSAGAPLAVRSLAPEAISAVLHTGLTRRIDRTEVKLMTWREYAQQFPDAVRPASVGETDAVWFVAVGGDIAKPGNFAVRWAVFAVDSRAETATLINAGADVWPPAFEDLPDHVPARQ